MKRRNLAAIVLSLLATVSVMGQDPSFSQFFSSPLNINPALTAQSNSKWRFISNIRDQWIGPASPYTTGTASFDMSIMEEKIPEGSTWGAGLMMMYDQAMRGALKSTYLSLNTSYNITLSEGDATHRMGIGIGGIFANKRVDFSKLSFGEQFVGYGFDTNLPTGESALSNMKPYLSASVGLLYSVTTGNSNFDIGAAGFHLNKPKQSVLEDPNQHLASRYVGHANFETYLNDQIILNTNAIYQRQENTSYVSFGGSLAYFLTGDPQDGVLSAGLWYWSKNAFIPFVGLSYGNLQFGLSYDITVSKLSQAAEKPKSFEISMIIRGNGKPKGVIWCPWK